jgi:hypothetical protein
MALTGLAFLGYGLYFAWITVSWALPEPQAGVPPTLWSSLDEAARGYVLHLQLVVSVLMAALGLVLAALAWFGVRRELYWTWGASVAAVAAVLTLAGAAHAYYGILAPGHLVPGYAAALVFAVGAALAAWGLWFVPTRTLRPWFSRGD